MKESDYINATDLAKLRIAYRVISDVFPSDDERRRYISGQLFNWIEEVEARVETEEDLDSGP